MAASGLAERARAHLERQIAFFREILGDLQAIPSLLDDAAIRRWVALQRKYDRSIAALQAEQEALGAEWQAANPPGDATVSSLARQSQSLAREVDDCYRRVMASVERHMQCVTSQIDAARREHALGTRYTPAAAVTADWIDRKA